MRAGTQLSQENDFRKHNRSEGFPNGRTGLPKLRTGRKDSLSIEDTRARQTKLGELCWGASVSGPHTRARSAKISSRIDSLCGRDAYRVNGLVRRVQERQKATVLKCASPSHSRRSLGLKVKDKDGRHKRGGSCAAKRRL